MKVTIKRWNAIAQWRWDTRTPLKKHKKDTLIKDSEGNDMILTDEQVDDPINDTDNDSDDEEDDVCGICRVAFEACCPACKTPGDDCPLIWGKCSHVFHMHCLLKWIGTAASKGQCPMDRREWENAER